MTGLTATDNSITEPGVALNPSCFQFGSSNMLRRGFVNHEFSPSVCALPLVTGVVVPRLLPAVR